MTTRIDTDEIESTRTERFLAVILTAFLLVGSIWFYVKVADWVRTDDPWRTSMSTEQRAVIKESQKAHRLANAADNRRWTAEANVEQARAEYDLALQAGEPAAGPKEAYQQAQQRLETAQQAARAARAEARQASAEADEVYREVDEDAGKINDGRDWAIAGIRFAFISGWILASFGLIRRLRNRESRYLPLGFAAAATGAVLTMVFTVDYVTDYIPLQDLGPIVLSALGALVTVLTFIGLQRRIVARIPGRRVRKGECPFCGHPVRERSGHLGPHCEGCGREVIASCSSCDEPRRVGSAHCATCGAT